MYDKLFNELYFKAKNFVIIALDPDAWDDTVKIYNKLDALLTALGTVNSNLSDVITAIGDTNSRLDSIITNTQP